MNIPWFEAGLEGRPRPSIPRWFKGFRIEAAVGILAVLGGGPAQARDESTDRWHVAATPPPLSEEVQFTNGDVHLRGTVYLPATGDRLPAVVVLHHAQLPHRDANLYRHLREGLTTIGVAVLVYDRRGSGQSSGDPNQADFETLAADAVAGQQALARLPRIDPRKIGFWGLSQGGWLAVLAAGHSRDAAFAISVSAPLVTAEEQMQFATRNLLALRGYSEADIEDMLAARRAWIGYRHGSIAQKEALEALRRAESRPWFGIAYLPRASQLTNDPLHDPSRRSLDDDPMTAVRQTRAPLLFLYAEADPWVPVGESVKRLRSLAAEMPSIEYAVIGGADHEMMMAGNESMRVDPETASKEAPQVPAYFMLVASWIARHVLK